MHGPRGASVYVSLLYRRLSCPTGNNPGPIPPGNLYGTHPRTTSSRSQVLHRVFPQNASFELLARRVHSHAASAFINVCEGVERQVLLPYLDAIIQRLLAMLQPGSKGWVQEQAVTTLAMVADVSEDTFRSVRSVCIRGAP